MRRAAPSLAFLLAAIATSAASAGDPAACPSYRAEPVAMTDPALCAELAAQIATPSASPLDAYEVALNAFAANFCHRNADAGWIRDKFIRLTGPRIATLRDGAWSSRNFGTHAPVVVWYSADMADWLRTWRADGAMPENAPPPPDGAIIVKEMFGSPTDSCRDLDPAHLFPEIGTAIMVRDAAGSRDGWFYGYSQNEPYAPDWPPRADSPPQGMGFGQYCINCHASAVGFTFASPENMLGEPGEPLPYLSQDFADHQPPSPLHDGAPPPAHGLGAPLAAPDAAVVAALRAFVADMPGRDAAKAMPAQTYDYDWIAAGGPGMDQTFTTASVCAGCHDAGSTGLQYDMTTPNPHGPGLINLSPFATWRTSPMGLAGRDPFFFAQLASEVETFHPESRDLIETTCLGCHGAAGARQFQIDAKAADGTCPPVPRSIVDAVPFPHGNPTADMARYGALARDGVTCTVCHRAVLKADAMAAALTEPQNACIEERQAQLNPDLTGFARTFTGSQPVGAPDAIIGPFADPKVVPMEHAIGMTPKHDPDIRSAEVCGSCHTVHLPVLRDGKTLGHVFEQTTYPEWAFSAYRTGTTPDGALPHGPGERSQTCQDCHMPRRDADGNLRVSKIASIQEFTNFPATTFSLGAAALDLPFREGFAEHTLVGLNLVLIKMAQQFPDILGIHTRDPISGDIGLFPLERTEDAILAQAASGTAEITVSDLRRDATTLSAAVTVTSHVGHKFPSGVGFRRAFLAFEVLDAEGAVLWASGRTNRGGVIVGRDGAPVDGELWWKNDCSARLHPGERRHQPHREVIGAEDEVQIYQELVATPPAGAEPGSCGIGAVPEGDLTTSFLSICASVKDNRILPAGTLPLARRVEIAEALGAGLALADEAGPYEVGDDPDYVSGGGDSVEYVVPLASLPAGAEPASLRATLYYQAQPPFYLQDRFCTSRSADTGRLRYMVERLDLAGTPAADWKLEVATTGIVPVPE
jgi:hypothetical protein